MDLMMTSNSSRKGSNNNIVAASAHQEAMDTTPHGVDQGRKVKQARKQSVAREPKPWPQPDEALWCPRCDSNNTKFCYYNNHNTSQPRYFCRACRRYWTQGGALRSVPIGGRCRKTRSSASSLPSSNSSSSSIDNQQQKQHHLLPISAIVEPQDLPHMLPTFMSSVGFELPGTHPSPPLMPLSLPSLEPSPPLPLTFGSEMSFVDLLGGGFHGDHQGNNNNGFYEPTNSEMDKWLIGDYGVGASPIGGGSAAFQGDQWSTTTQAGVDQQQEGGVSASDSASSK